LARSHDYRIYLHITPDCVIVAPRVPRSLAALNPPMPGGLMHKLKLDPEMLTVESFAPDASAGDAAGTVRGHSFVTDHPYQACGSDEPSAYCQDTDFHADTCGVSYAMACLLTGNDPTCIH
jgi:hypothetical protein